MFVGALEKGMVFVSESTQLTGFIAGLPFPCPLNQTVTMVSELAWWVEPEYRNTGAAIRLFQALQRAAESYGALSLTMICLESIEPEKVQGIYERMGHTKTESSFVRFF